MDGLVGMLSAAVGVATTPLVLAAARWAPKVGRARSDPSPARPAGWVASAASGGHETDPADEVASAPPQADPVGAPGAGWRAQRSDRDPLPPHTARVRGTASASGATQRDRRLARTVLVALGLGLVLGLLGAQLGADPALVAYAVFGLVGGVLVLVDLAEHRLPDVLTLPSYVIGVALLGLATLLGSGTGNLGRALLGAVVALGLYALLYLVLPTGIGAGDVKYAGVVGLHAAWLGWDSLLVTLFGGFFVGGLISVLLLATRRAGLKSRVPFGPSMFVGALIGIVAGTPLADAWLGG